MGLRRVALLLAALAIAPAAAAPAPPPAAEPRTSFELAGTFAYGIEYLSFGFRAHPRVSIRIWRGTPPPPTPSPTYGTIELGLFGGWSQVPAALIGPALMSGGGTFAGSGADHVLLLASAGSTAHTETRHGHVLQIGIHLLGGWTVRHDQARITIERYGIDASYEETAHGALAGFVLSPAVLFGGRVGPTFEASFFPLATHRGLAHWHVGLGLAVRLGGADPAPDRAR